jgi:hypothetical protein
VAGGTDLVRLKRGLGFCHGGDPWGGFRYRRDKPMSLVVTTEVATLFLVDIRLEKKVATSPV